jgi:hypothetical protein
MGWVGRECDIGWYTCIGTWSPRECTSTCGRT